MPPSHFFPLRLVLANRRSMLVPLTHKAPHGIPFKAADQSSGSLLFWAEVHLALAGSSAIAFQWLQMHLFFCSGALQKRSWRRGPRVGGRGRRAHVSIRGLEIMHGLFRRRGRRPHAKTHTYPNGRAHLAWELLAQNAFSLCGAHARQHSRGHVLACF